ncbi:MAG TPA: urease accessory protein UreD [Woeseiaceae bacterium]|nr:urease accessory protein UreD [Woeseiaceae bacterium]
MADLFQEGCLKLRLPRPVREGEADLVIMNTAGGLTGGDRLSIEVSVGNGARTTATTPACEHIYRSIDGESVIEQRLQVARGARLDWLPQGTILFDRGRVRRRLEIQLEADAEITVAEAVLFGRTEMGETVNSGTFSDLWTVRRGDSLLYADAMRIAEPFGRTVACSTTLDRHAAMASLLHVGRDLAAKRDALRAGFAQDYGALAGASVVGDVLIARIVAADGNTLRRLLIAALGPLRDRRSLPRNWFC